MGSYNNAYTWEVISDTGTSWMGAPMKELEEVATVTGASYDQNDGVFVVDCGLATTGPSFTLKINNVDYTISAIEVVF